MLHICNHNIIQSIPYRIETGSKVITQPISEELLRKQYSFRLPGYRRSLAGVVDATLFSGEDF